MLFLQSLPLSITLAIRAAAQVTITGTAVATSTNLGDNLPTGSEVTYLSYGSTQSVPSTSITSGTATISAANSSDSTQKRTSSSGSVTLLSGGEQTSLSLNGTRISNSTASSTSSSALPTNTQPCNGYTEFCARSFSNITYVAAHNSPFSKVGNAASNQALDVTTQLNNGIRMLQFQTHYENDTIWLCHTSCEILNVGTLTSYLKTVRQWVAANPFEVITILMGNDDLIEPGNYTAPVTDSGLLHYAYTPPKVPMGIDDWPTTQEMILSGTRVVTMLDYNANQTAIPWLMDEFGQMWESPFSPQDPSFPCTAQRPPATYAGALPRTNRMYMANHNLNVEVSLLGASLLVPAYTSLNETNADGTTFSSLGLMADNCTATWNRPPNYLLVDYYNVGNFNGSVFQVAADMNNVSYNKASCCGSSAQKGAATSLRMPRIGTFVSMFLSVAIGLLVPE